MTLGGNTFPFMLPFFRLASSGTWTVNSCRRSDADGVNTWYAQSQRNDSSVEKYTDWPLTFVLLAIFFFYHHVVVDLHFRFSSLPEGGWGQGVGCREILLSACLSLTIQKSSSAYLQSY